MNKHSMLIIIIIMVYKSHINRISNSQQKANNFQNIKIVHWNEDRLLIMINVCIRQYITYKVSFLSNGFKTYNCVIFFKVAKHDQKITRSHET